MDPGLREVVEEDGLVGEDVGRVAVEVVLLEQVVVEEARRSGARHDERRGEDLDVALGPGELDDPLLVGEGDLRLRRELVDHRVPDRARELEEQQVERPEGQELVRVGRARVVHVQDAGLAVVDEQRRVAERAVGRGVERHDQDPQTAAELERLAVGGLDEPPEAEVVELVAEVVDRVVGQDDGRVLRAVLAQPVRVEVIVVEVADVEVVGAADRPRVDPVVGREREPRPEVGGVEPRVAQDAAGPGLEVQRRPGRGR